MDRKEQQRATSRPLVVGLLVGAVVAAVIFMAGGAVRPFLAPGWGELIQGLAFFIGLITAVVIVRVGLRRRRSAG